jgi:1,4-alpha-glucan branching enzyme
MDAVLSSYDVYLFHQGTLNQSYRTLGAHLIEFEGVYGVRFVVWAPNAASVSVVGDFNHWDGHAHPMECYPDSGLWWVFIPGLSDGTVYKYAIWTPHVERPLLKADPYAFQSEVRPATASIVHSLGQYEWSDEARKHLSMKSASYNSPVNIYEVHLGTWKRPGKPDDEYDLLSYSQLADDLIEYVVHMGYTHIELLPVAEHPYDRSWGYQITGFYSVTSRFGSPNAFKSFVDRCHSRGIGVILDWVPAHFVRDEHGLRAFDGSALYEPEDSRLAEKPLWGTLAFDYSKPEVSGFLISNALFWMDEYHIDGLRVDAVASMLDMNFDKPQELWLHNEDGSTENRAAVEFLRRLNEIVFHHYPNALMIAEDSSSRPLVSAPVYAGGLGFNYKWNMGWMNDTLRFMKREPSDRSSQLNHLLFSFLYMHSENFILPLSHDEVVHGKKSLLNKMPGDMWRKFANLRLLYTFMFTHPGKKLLFMGGEFGQFDEWKDLEQLDWMLLEQYQTHRDTERFVRDLNHFYKNEPALWELDYAAEGVQWIDVNDSEQCVICLIRRARDDTRSLLCVLNFSADAYREYRIGVPDLGVYEEAMNSDRSEYGGSGLAQPASMMAEELPWHGQPYSIAIQVPPLAGIYLRRRS